MTAHDQMRAMLDQLMGTSRNGEEEKLAVKFDDPGVCKSFLLSCCPHEILASTRMDLGDCPKIHNLALRADYETAAKKKDYFYDLEALEQLESFIHEADRKTDQAKKRLADTQEELSSEASGKAEKVNELAEKIGESLAKAEELGEQGLVDESMKLMEEVDNLRKQKAEAEAEYRAAIPAAAYQQQKLRVCEVCCAYLGIHDNDRRLADHFGGKLHLGFIKIRDTLKEFQTKIEERRRQRRETVRRDDGHDRDRGRYYEKDDRRKSGRDLDRHQDREDRNKEYRDRTNRNRDRERHRLHSSSSTKKRSRTRSRSRTREERSKDRK